MLIKVVSSPRLSGIGMPSPILWSHPLKMQRIVLRSSLLWWVLGTNSLITGPGEWLSFRRFTSKLSWSWSWATITFFLSFSNKLKLDKKLKHFSDLSALIFFRKHSYFLGLTTTNTTTTFITITSATTTISYTHVTFTTTSTTTTSTISVGATTIFIVRTIILKMIMPVMVVINNDYMYDDNEIMMTISAHLNLQRAYHQVWFKFLAHTASFTHVCDS